MAENTQNSWSPCPEGELTSLAASLRAVHRVKTMRRVAVTSSLLVVLICVFLGVQNWRHTEPDLAPKRGLACHEVADVYGTYLAGNLSDEMTERVSAHIDACPHCRKHLRENDRTSTQVDVAKRQEVAMLAPAW